MKLLIALDSFKGTMSALEACETVKEGMMRSRPGWSYDLLPAADGGEGTAAALAEACDGEKCIVPNVVGPLPEMRVQADYVYIPSTHISVVEMASASGLPLLKSGQKDPLRATTFGTGECLQNAFDKGSEQILLTLGGSATVDGGTGAAHALGWKFLNKHGHEIPEGGEALLKLHEIVPPNHLDSFPLVKALCDVDNPLCGPNGAAHVYGPQKGATPDNVKVLDEALNNLAACIKKDLGKDVLNLPGAGAAGGFGAGACAFLNAELVPGFDAVAEASGLDEKMKNVDWVVTGEGRFDSQSLQGKVVSGMLKYAAAHNVKTAVLAGSLQLEKQLWQAAGIAIALSTTPKGMSDMEAIPQGQKLLLETAQRLTLLLEK